MTKKKVKMSQPTSDDSDNTKTKDAASQDQPPPISFFKLYRFSTSADKFLMCLGILSAFGTGALQPLNTILFGDLTNNIIKFASSEITKDEFLDAINYFALMNSCIGIGMLILTYVSTETFNFTALKQTYKIRSLYFQKVLNQDIAWYDVHQTGDFASRMSEDLSKLEDGIGEKVPTFINFQSVFVASLIIALVKGWELALVCLTSLPVSMLAIGIITILTTKIAKKELDAYGSAGAIAEEVLSSLRTVIAFGGQAKEMARYDEQLKYAKNNNIRRAIMTAIGFGLLWFFIYGSYALAFWYGMKLVLEQIHEKHPTYTIANMITVFLSVMTGSMNFGISSPYIEAFSVARAAGSKIFQVIDNQPIINASKTMGKNIEKLMGNVTFKEVKFSYPSRQDVQVLQGLNLEIKAGETVALVGSSGCGKSTCTQLIQRFYDPASGEVLLDGVNLKDLNLTWLRSMIGVVGQEPILFGTSIEENIRNGNRNATLEDIKQAAKKANAHEFIKKIPNGYHALVGERGTQLSGGQKQRIAIARALVRNPSILLMDEATSALDTNSEAQVQKAIDMASKHCTTIIIAHRLSTIRGANKIVVISKGQVVEQGTHDELMALKKEYYTLVNNQIQGVHNEEAEATSSTVEFDDERKDSLIQEEEILEELDDADQSEKPSILTILRMNRPEWFQITLGCLGSIIMGAAMPVFAILFGNIISVSSGNATPDSMRAKTNEYCVYLVIAGVVTGLSTFFQIYMFSIAGEKLTMRIRSRVFAALLRQEIGFFDLKVNSVGALCSKLSEDAAHVQGATGQRIGTILQSISTLILSVGLSMYYEWKLGLVAMAFTPFILIATFLQSRLSMGDDKKKSNSLQKSTKIAVEAVSNVRTVASLGCEDLFHNQYMLELKPIHKRSLRTTHLRAIVFGLARSIMFFAYSVCMFYGGYLIIDGMDYSNVFKVSQSLIMGTVSIANALAFAPNFQKGLTAANKVQKLLNRVPKIKDLDDSDLAPQDNGTIEYSNIQFSYPTRPTINVLNDLNLEVFQGKTVALVGPSGCGKSTIIQLIERFYDPSKGTITYCNKNIRKITIHSLRNELGIVSQEPNLFNRTIGDNIAYGDNSKEIPQADIIDAAKKANIHNFIAKLPLGYETKLGEKGTQLSGGEKQRIAIARALIRNPKILLLDEATSALDTESEKIVQEALDNAKEGRTCITIAHRLTTIQDADVICVINKGKVAEIGTHEELVKLAGLYYKLHSLQKKQ